MKKLTFFVAVAIAISLQMTAIFGQKRPITKKTTPVAKPTVTKTPVAEPTPTPKPVEVSPAQKFFDEGLKCDAKDYDCQISNYTKAINLDLKTKDVFKNRANAYLGRGDFDKAVEDLTRIIELDKNDAQSYKTRGLAYSAMPDNKGLDAAIKDFTSAIELEPKDADAYNKRGEALLKMNQTEKAMADFDKVISLNPNNVDVYLNRGKIYLITKRYDKAIADFSKSITLKNDNAESYNNRGDAFSWNKNYDKAFDDYNKALNMNPNNADSYLRRGGIYLLRKDYDKAIEDYSKAISLDSSNSQAYSSRAIASFVKKGSYDEQANQDLRIAYRLDIENSTKAIEINPKNIQAYLKRGQAYSGAKQYDKAIEDFTKAIQINPDYAIAYLNRSLAFTYKGGNTEQAERDSEKFYTLEIQELSKILDSDSNNVEDLMKRADAYSILKKYEKAVEDYTKIINLDSNNKRAYSQRAYAFTQLYGYDDSRAKNDEAKANSLEITSTPNNAQGYFDRGRSLADAGNHIKAIEDFSKAIELNPKVDYYFVYRSNEYFALKNFQKGLEDLTNIINLKPNDSERYLKRGQAYSEQLKDYDKAIEDFSKAIELEPKNVNYYYWRSSVYRDLKMPEKQLKELELAVQVNPTSAKAYSNLGNYYNSSIKETDIKKAVEYYQKAAELEPNNTYYTKDVDTAKNRLAEKQQRKDQQRKENTEAILNVMQGVTNAITKTPSPQTTNTPPTNNSGGQSSGANNSSGQGGDSSQSSINDPNMIHGGFFGIKTPPSEACVEREGIKNCWGAWQTNPAYPYIQFRVMGPIKNTYNAIDNTPNVKSYYWQIDFKNTSSNIVALNFKVTYSDGKVDTNGHNLTPQEHSNSLSMFHTFSNSGTISLQFTEVKTCSNFTRVGQGTNADGYQCNNK